jgi:hypothetical protein
MGAEPSAPSGVEFRLQRSHNGPPYDQLGSITAEPHPEADVRPQKRLTRRNHSTTLRPRNVIRGWTSPTART